MPNMGYCRFQNTLIDLRDCQDSMNEGLSPEEAKARAKLIQLCREIVADADYEEDNDDTHD